MIFVCLTSIDLRRNIDLILIYLKQLFILNEAIAIPLEDAAGRIFIVISTVDVELNLLHLIGGRGFVEVHAFVQEVWVLRHLHREVNALHVRVTLLFKFKFNAVLWFSICKFKIGILIILEPIIISSDLCAYSFGWTSNSLVRCVSVVLSPVYIWIERAAIVLLPKSVRENFG